MIGGQTRRRDRRRPHRPLDDLMSSASMADESRDAAEVVGAAVQPTDSASVSGLGATQVAGAGHASDGPASTRRSMSGRHSLRGEQLRRAAHPTGARA
jgi:hypothetical protein